MKITLGIFVLFVSVTLSYPGPIKTLPCDIFHDELGCLGNKKHTPPCAWCNVSQVCVEWNVCEKRPVDAAHHCSSEWNLGKHVGCPETRMMLIYILVVFSVVGIFVAGCVLVVVSLMRGKKREYDNLSGNDLSGNNLSNNELEYLYFQDPLRWGSRNV